jgi:outer membrane protein, heavy metal efflux system
MLQKDYTGTPFNVDPSVQVTIPLPVWDRNQGGIIQAQGNAVNASEESHRVRADLTTRLADAFERYNTNRVLLGYYRDQILPDLVRSYRGIYQRYQTEMAPGALPGAVAPPAAVTAPPQFADVVVGQQNLANAIVTYVQTLGLAWQAVVDVADLLQTDDIYRVGDQVFPTECVAPLPDIGPLPPLPCFHPCSPLPDPALKGANGDWPSPEGAKEPKKMPPAEGGKEPRKMPPASESKKPQTNKAVPAMLPPFTETSRQATPRDAATVKWPDRPVLTPAEVQQGVDPKLLEPPPDLPRQ